MKYKLLDCTLRDGGYYNNWFFSKKLTQEYLNAMSKAGIKYVELGFRSPKKNIYKGPNWYTSDEYIENKSFVSKEELIEKSDIIILGVPHKNYDGINLPKDKYIYDMWNFLKAGEKNK